MKRVIGICLVVIGISIGTYHFTQWETGRSAAKEMTRTEIKNYKLEVAKQKTNNHPEFHVQQQKPSSDVKHEQGEKVAMLVIPKVGQKFSVFWGANKNVLKKGVGMYVSNVTTTPDQGGNTVLSGHRDTVFYRLDELKENEILKLEYANSIFTYKITKIKITDPQDQTVIVKKDSPTLTLTTCYPFNYTGYAPKRYIIQAALLYKEDSSFTYNEKMLQKKKGIQ